MSSRKQNTKGMIGFSSFLTLVLVCAALPPVAWGQQIYWTRQFGTGNFDAAFAVSVDASGIYVAGITEGAMPGQTSAGGHDAFVRKYDASGNEVWTRQFGTAGFDQAYATSVYASEIYVAGMTQGDLPGQTFAGGTDAFVRKYDAAGTELWTRQLGLTGSNDLAGAVAVGASGIYVAGYKQGIFADVFEAFVRKFDADGNSLWTRQFETGTADIAQGISVDDSGVYVAGLTQGTLPSQTKTGFQDAFIRKYDTAGNELWTRQFGTGGSQEARGISVEASGVYVVGDTTGTLAGQTTAGDRDAFVRKYDAAGNEVWTRQFGSAAAEFATGIFVNASGIYLAGITTGTLTGQISAGYFDAFVGRLPIQTPAELLEQLIADMVALDLRTGIETSLGAKLQAARKALDDLKEKNDSAAVNALQSFINAVEAQRGSGVSSADADVLINNAQQIIALLM